MCSNRQEGKKPTQVPCELAKWGLASRSPNFHLNILSLIWSLVIRSILSLSPIDGGRGQRWKFQLWSLVTLRVQPLLSYWYLILSKHLLENPMDGGAWWAAVHGVANSQSDFLFTFHFHALEKEMATHSSVLAWRIPGTEEPGGLPSLGMHRVGHNWSGLAAAAAANTY